MTIHKPLNEIYSLIQYLNKLLLVPRFCTQKSGAAVHRKCDHWAHRDHMISAVPQCFSQTKY